VVFGRTPGGWAAIKVLIQPAELVIIRHDIGTACARTAFILKKIAGGPVPGGTKFSATLSETLKMMYELFSAHEKDD
jgi:hypothetical protein